MTRKEMINASLNTARANLSAIQAAQSAAVIELAHTPEDTNLIASLERLRVEAGAAESRVRELEGALKVAEKRDTADGRAERRQAVKERHAATIAKAEKRIALAAKIDRAFATLSPLLAQWREVGLGIGEDFRAMTTTAVEDIRLRSRYLGDGDAIALGTSALFGCALVEQLANTGLFADGGVPHPANVNPDLTIYSARGGMSLEHAATIAADRLSGLLERFAVLADANLGPLPEAVHDE